MTEPYAYPPGVAAALRRQWPAHGLALPTPAVLTRFIAEGYQASLLREEDRPVQCHLFLRPVLTVEQLPAPPAEIMAAYQILVFHTPRGYTSQELRRLSPITQRPGTLLSVGVASTGELLIQGLVFATRPWDHVDAPHDTALLPPALYMQVAGPGRLAFFCGAQPVLVLHQGQLGDYSGRAFPAGWLSGFAEPEAEADRGKQAEFNPELARQLGSHSLHRCLARVRAQGHGGLLVLVPSASGPQLVSSAGLLRPKYDVRQNSFGIRYRDLLARLVARSAALGITTWAAYRLATDGELQQLHTELEQFADLLADLMAVDGALVLDKQFGLFGFGVEIAAPAPATPLVYRALDAEGRAVQAEAADSGGTRHRAAYRLCQAEAGCLAIVVSQDGNIRLVRQRAGQVLFWNQLIL